MKFSADCCDCFAGLATKNRIKIVNLLQKEGRLPVLEIARHFRLAQPTITHHLHYLKEAGLLDSVKKGRQVFYFVSQKCKEGKCGLFS